MANERAWFLYNGAAGGELTSTNYIYITFVPTCQTRGEFICSVKGIYDFDTYENHPAPFSLDTKMQQYIIDAKAAELSKPSGTGIKAYVYVHD